MAAIDKVKILVLGDSGVGKTCLTHLIAHNEAIKNPAWTVGCSVEVRLHEYREGYPNKKTFFIELWDVGGSSSHRNTRSIYYNSVQGVILVHDLTNKKSQHNLTKWLAEVLNYEAGGKIKGNEEIDAEMMLGSSNLPILVIGTKLNLAPTRTRGLSFAEEVGADEITLDCHVPRSLAAGTSAAVKLSRFFDRVIERKFPEKSPMIPGPFGDKRRPVYSPNNAPKYFHKE